MSALPSRRRALGALAWPMTMSLAACGASPASREPWRARLDAELDALVADPARPVLSVSALVLREGRVSYQHQVGRARVGRPGGPGDQPVGPRTLFRVASISKLVVTLAVLRLVEQGRLDLDADVGQVLGWPLRNPGHPAVPITLRLLLSHRASLADGDGEVYGWGAEVALREVLMTGGTHYRDGAHWQPAHAPGTWFQYCNLNFGVIATVMERATGQRFDHLMRHLVLDPLGLRGGFEPSAFPAADVAEVATMYRKRREVDGRGIWVPDGPWVAQADDFGHAPPTAPPGLAHYTVGSNGTLFGPQGRLRIALPDLGVVMRMLLAEGRHGEGNFLQPASVRELYRELWRFDPAQPNGRSRRDGAQSWGLGAQRFVDVTGDGRGDRLVEGGGFSGYGHLGDAYGMMAVFALDPLRRHGVVLLITGPGVDPAGLPPRWSAMYRWQELALTSIWRHALQAAPRGHMP